MSLNMRICSTSPFRFFASFRLAGPFVREIVNRF